MTELLKISLPDGSIREMPLGSTPADVAAAIGPGLAKAALAARIDGQLGDLSRSVPGGAGLAVGTTAHKPPGGAPGRRQGYRRPNRVRPHHHARR